MGKGIKKAAAIGAAVITLLTGSMITGCFGEREYPERITYEYEDFKYRMIPWVDVSKEGNEYDTKHIYLRGLTEEGKKKEVIVVPTLIDGYFVTKLSMENASWSVETKFEPAGLIESESLKAIYLPNGIDVGAEKTFAGCPNLEKIVCLAPIVFFEAKLNEGQKRYIRFCDANLDKNGTAKCGESKYCANVSYFYNYETVKNDGYYWIDNFAYGEKIEYIPEEPTRTGYVFGGWYMEESCENKWDFEVNTLPEAKYNEEGNELYQETRLYAKWIKE